MGGESVKVLDFGIAKLKEGKSVEGGLTLTGTGVVIGTPQYMSPEQAMGKNAVTSWTAARTSTRSAW